MTPETGLYFIGGLALLIIGAEALVRGASRLAEALGMSPLIVGLTIVAFGTSAPELSVSVHASLSGMGDMAIGNVVGSNMFNVLFILGLSALITPLAVTHRLVRIDVPIMIGVSGLLLLFARDGRIDRLEGGLFALGILLHTGFLIYKGLTKKGGFESQDRRNADRERRFTVKGILVQIALIVGGLSALVLGSKGFVAGSIDVARMLGVSELVIALTLVAAGTSLPEVATSVVAALRGERDIAIGNVVGSNIFNVLCVLGFSAVVGSEGIAVPQAAIRFDIPVMVAVSLACLPVFFTGYKISRWEGLFFLGYYGAYSSYLILDAQGHDSLETFRAGMIFFALPMTGLMLLVFSTRSLLAFRRGKEADTRKMIP